LKKKKKGCGGKDFAEKEGFKSGMKVRVGGCAKKSRSYWKRYSSGNFWSNMEIMM